MPEGRLQRTRALYEKPEAPLPIHRNGFFQLSCGCYLTEQGHIVGLVCAKHLNEKYPVYRGPLPAKDHAPLS